MCCCINEGMKMLKFWVIVSMAIVGMWINVFGLISNNIPVFIIGIVWIWSIVIYNNDLILTIRGLISARKEQEDKMYDNNFNDVLEDAQLIYQQKKSKYGESWKDMSIRQLDNRLTEEIEEYEEAGSEGYLELLDIINIALMLCKKIRPLTDENTRP